jgi:chemotaxis protein histidine kinase CheA
MSHVKKHKDKKPVKSESNIILTKGMETFKKLSGKKIKSNPKQFSKKKKKDRTKKNSVDFHWEIVKKIDALIAEHKKETASQEESEDSSERIVEIREPLKRKLEATNFKTDIRAENIFNCLDFENEPFKVELSGRADPGFKFVRNLEEPKDIVYIRDLDHLEKNDDFHSKMLGGLDKTNQKPAKGFARIKIRSRGEKAKLKDAEKKLRQTSSSQNIKNVIEKKDPEKVNGFTLVKQELEETKKEIEEKKKELELAEKRAKEEAGELKEKKKEKLEKEKEEKKLKKLELKKAKIEAKEREKRLREKTKIEAKKKKLEAKMALKEEKLKRKLESKKKKIGKPEQEPASVLKARKTDDLKRKEKSNISTTGLHHFILGKREVAEENPILDEDIRQVLRITDNLLEKLPNEVIDEFVQSEDFTLYEKVISKYKIK